MMTREEQTVRHQELHRLKMEVGERRVLVSISSLIVAAGGERRICSALDLLSGHWSLRS